MKKIVTYILGAIVLLYLIIYALGFALLKAGILKPSTLQTPVSKNENIANATPKGLALVEFGRKDGKDIYIHAQQWNGTKEHYQALRKHAQQFKGNTTIKTIMYFDTPFQVPPDKIFGGIKNQEKCIASYIVPIDNFTVNPNGAMNKNGKEKFIEPK